MKPRKSLLTLMLLTAMVAGCGIQDSTQPAENSISAAPKSDGPLVKARKTAKANPATRLH
jgi:hypothetical protein